MNNKITFILFALCFLLSLPLAFAQNDPITRKTKEEKMPARRQERRLLELVRRILLKTTELSRRFNPIRCVSRGDCRSFAFLTARQMLVFLIAGVCASAMAGHIPGHNDGAIVSGNDEAQLPESRAFNYSMAPRYALGWEMYDQSTHRYNPEYLYPPNGYEFTLDACDTRLAEQDTITQFSWVIRNPVTEDILAQELAGISCRYSSRLPLGTHNVTLTVSLANGETISNNGNIALRDLLVVSLGDSNASGEGNTGDGWEDERCNRSRVAGPAVAAKLLEDSSAITSVTFVSFACSGAETLVGLLGGYEGINPIDGPEITNEERFASDLREVFETARPVSEMQLLPPQVSSVRMLQCRYKASCPQPRAIDHLLLSVGINELGFGTIVLVCGEWATYEDYARQVLRSVVYVFDWLEYQKGISLGPIDDILSIPFEIWDDIGDFLFADTNCVDNFEDTVMYLTFQQSDLYRLLNRTIREVLYVNNIHITEYPTSVFQHFYDNPELRSQVIAEPNTSVQFGGCGLMKEISAGEARWMTAVAERLNKMIELTSEKLFWNYVSGIASDFEGHGYCAERFGGVTYFRNTLDPFVGEDNHSGPLHPNVPGHEVTARHLFESLQWPRARYEPTRQLTVNVDAWRLRTIWNNELQTDVPPMKIGVHLSHDWGSGEIVVVVDELVSSEEWTELEPGAVQLQLNVMDFMTVRLFGQAGMVGIGPATSSSVPRRRLRDERWPIVTSQAFALIDDDLGVDNNDPPEFEPLPPLFDSATISLNDLPEECSLEPSGPPAVAGLMMRVYSCTLSDADASFLTVDGQQRRQVVTFDVRYRVTIAPLPITVNPEELLLE